MPNNIPQPPQNQAPQMSPLSPQQQGKQEINPEKMLVQMLKEMEQEIAELGQRVDVLEQKSGEQPS